jgi:hypothetical protein
MLEDRGREFRTSLDREGGRAATVSLVPSRVDQGQLRAAAAEIGERGRCCGSNGAVVVGTDPAWRSNSKGREEAP